MNTKKAIIASVVSIMASAAAADIARVAEFDSLQFEGFDSERWVFERGTKEIFGGMGEIFGQGGYIHTTNGWGYSNGDWRGRTSAYDGSMLGNSRGTIVYRFNEQQRSFGGFFATIANVADGKIKFYDSNDSLVAENTVNAAVGGEWAWNGWSIAQGFNRVEVTANYNDGAGGFLMHDSIRLSSFVVPAPGALAMLLTGGLIAARRRR